MGTIVYPTQFVQSEPDTYDTYALRCALSGVTAYIERVRPELLKDEAVAGLSCIEERIHLVSKLCREGHIGLVSRSSLKELLSLRLDLLIRLNESPKQFVHAITYGSEHSIDYQAIADVCNDHPEFVIYEGLLDLRQYHVWVVDSETQKAYDPSYGHGDTYFGVEMPKHEFLAVLKNHQEI